MSFRLAAYAVCIEDARVLLARHVSPKGESNWTLPAAGSSTARTAFDAVIREVCGRSGRSRPVDPERVRARCRTPSWRAEIFQSVVEKTSVGWCSRVYAGSCHPSITAMALGELSTA